MGDEVSTGSVTGEQRQRYREKLHLCLDVLGRLLDTREFDGDRPLTGLEIEFSLVDDAGRPAMLNRAVLDRIADPGFQTELGAYNIELNVPPRPLPGRSAFHLEEDLRASLNAAERRANEIGARIVMIGILPTVMPETFEGEWMSESVRYSALNDSISASRGEDLHLDIEGAERLAVSSTSIAPESACTSVQLHLQVAPDRFPAAWNAAQALAGPQVAIGANSPFFFGRHLWAETRTEVFAQATDTRPAELRNQGVRPRVFFGERWISSFVDLFEENVRYFPSLLPELTDEDPVAVLEAGRIPALRELRLHNGTVYRWNRPVYDVVDGRPHVRVENRVLPAGPTVVDVMANAAFYYGVARVLAEDEDPLWRRMAFATAHENFQRCARDGLDATVYWPGLGEVTVDELTVRRLLPMAREGLRRWRVGQDVIDRYLGIIEERVTTGRNGATWQVRTVRAHEDAGADRARALSLMLAEYVDRMHSNDPVHTWPVP